MKSNCCGPISNSVRRTTSARFRLPSHQYSAETGTPQNDELGGDSNSNALSAGLGTDTVSFASAPAGVSANLATGQATGVGSGPRASEAVNN